MSSAINYSEAETTIKEQFLNVLNNKSIKTVFQPIVSLRDGSIYGYEALSRGPENTIMQSPDKLFAYAEKYSKTWDLELLCRIKALETVYDLHTDLRLFLNVNPNVMHDSKFRQGFTKEYLHQYNINPENIIFEITEKGSVSNIADFTKTVDHYKGQHYKIAIDDAGAGYSGLNMISDIQPHFIKLDMNLIRDIDKDATKQALVKSFTEFAELTNTSLIAEGIETKNELLKLIDIGIHYGQGFYLQKPFHSIRPLSEDLIFTIKEANTKKNHILYKNPSNLYVSNISYFQKTLNPNILIGQVYELMENDHSLFGFCITQDDKIVGIITRSAVYKYLSGQYGYNLYYKKAIKEIMSIDFLAVDYHESIVTVSKKAMGRVLEHMYDFIAVVKDGKYFGVVTVKDLLEKTIEAEVNNAKYLNPLSELPGNVLIEKKMEECIHSSFACYVMYFDIDNFKAYNDVYGFENGDRILKKIVQILRNSIIGDKNFIGHVGGDDFIAVIYENNVKFLCEQIIDQFNEAIPDFYNKNDYKAGYITTKNRRGIEEDFPLMSISIAVVSCKNYRTPLKLSEDIALLKKKCKQMPGSNYIID